MDVQIVPTPAQWISTHLSLIGWPAIVYATYCVTRFLSKMEVRVVEFEKNFEKATTNDLPHIQASISGLDNSVQGMRLTLGGLRQDLQYYVYHHVSPSALDGQPDA